MRTQTFTKLPLLLGFALSGCTNDVAAPPPRAPTVAPQPPVTAPQAATAPAAPLPNKPEAIDRATFNRRAVELNQPIFWAWDKNGDHAIQPDEVKSLLFYPTVGHWSEGGALTKEFHDTYELLSRADDLGKGDDAELQRRKLVRQDLAAGAPTLVYTDLTKLSPNEKDFVRHMLAAAKAIDALYASQRGADKLAANVPADDHASQSLFRRNWGPACFTPATQRNPACSAIPGAPKLIAGVYPESLQKDPKFCDALRTSANARDLRSPFVAIQEKDGKLIPVPYSTVFKGGMEEVSRELNLAAAAVIDPKEAPLKRYLSAAAAAFENNHWDPADEAWTKMSATNSNWYVRVAPDEVYWDPCVEKAGFHLQLARIDHDSLSWQDKLRPVQRDMEKTLADLIGAPYKDRDVKFNLPDFVSVVVNAGDARMPTGGLLGESLPNVGPVAKSGRGRNVIMTNVFQDPDTRANRRAIAASLFSSETITSLGEDGTPTVLSTVLHEATHKLGPTEVYKLNKKSSSEAFGGPLASMLEELKAQSGALFFVEYARKHSLIDGELAKRTYLDSMLWALSQASRGMYDETHKPKGYSQLAAIQIGFLLDQGALTWDPQGLAANGTDKGAFTLHFDKMPAAAEALMKQVGAIKATMDKAGAEALVKKYVDGGVIPEAAIVERARRFPSQSLVYAVDL